MAIKLCVFASSTTALFFRGLIDACAKSRDPIEWSVIFPQGHFRYVLSDVIAKERRLYLFEHFDRHYAALDDAQIQRAMASGEGLVSALMRDKNGYRWLPKEEQAAYRGAAMHACYREIPGARWRPTSCFFPVSRRSKSSSPSLCARNSRSAFLLLPPRCGSSGRAFFSADVYESLPQYFGAYTNDDVQVARQVIDRFRAKMGNEPGDRYPLRHSLANQASFARHRDQREYLRWRYERRHCSEETLLMRITRHAQPLVRRLRQRRFDLTSARYFDVTKSQGSLPEKFVFYGLHMTPESSINALEPYYVDQLRPIDAPLLSLPRDTRWWSRSTRPWSACAPIPLSGCRWLRPALVLVHPDYDTRDLIARAAVVATVTGTVGLEAYLLDKPCVMFGPNFFVHLCHKAPGLHELAPLVRRLATEFRVPITGAGKGDRDSQVREYRDGLRDRRSAVHAARHGQGQYRRGTGMSLASPRAARCGCAPGLNRSWVVDVRGALTGAASRRARTDRARRVEQQSGLRAQNPP